MAAYREGMKKAGFKRIEDVPKEQRGKVFNIVNSILQTHKMQPKSAPTAMEQNDSADF